MGRISLLFSVVFCAVVPVFSGKHSLFYTYTALSKPLNLPGIYDFTAVGMLDDRLIDYYSSKTQVKVPKQDWMREKMEPGYWEKGTESRKSKEQWFKVNVEILIERMRHNTSDLHVLQWRHGCVIDEVTDGNLKFVSGVDEYSYDGAEFLSFDEVNSRWIAPVPAAEPTKIKWDGVTILNQYTKGYLEKECVDWLTKFMDYGKEQLKNHSSPDLYIFAKKSITDPNKLTLSCLATGFLPPDARMQLRKSRTALPDHLVTSSGIVPNGDGTYQLRSHTNIVKDPEVVYDCHVTHSTLERPIIEEWVFEEEAGITVIIIGAAVGSVLVLGLMIGLIVFLKKKGINTSKSRDNSQASSTSDVPSAEECINMESESKGAEKDADGSSDSGKGSSDQSSPESSQDNIDEKSKMLS